MARRGTTKRERRAIVSLILLFLVIGAVVKVIEGIGGVLGAIDAYVYLVAVVTVGLAIIAWFVLTGIIRIRTDKEILRLREQARQQRYQQLFSKYKNEEIVINIMDRLVWMGMTKEQLRDSLGAPEDTGRKITKSKIVEEYRYGNVGKNRFLRRVTIENDVVIGWSKK